MPRNEGDEMSVFAMDEKLLKEMIVQRMVQLLITD